MSIIRRFHCIGQILCKHTLSSVSSPFHISPLSFHISPLSFHISPLSFHISPLSSPHPSGYVTETEDVYEVTTEENDIALRCGVPGGEPYQLVYWYKNRQPLAVGQVDYNLVGYSWEIEGVYQCFVVTATGVVNQTTWRVFNNRKFMKRRSQSTCKHLLQHVC